MKPSTIITLPGPKVRVTLCDAKYFTEKELKKLIDALCVLSYVLNSDEFQKRVESTNFTSTKLASQTIYKEILASDEEVDGVEGTFGMDHGDEDYEVDLALTMYSSRFSKVVGYSLPERTRIWINRKFFTWYSPWHVAGNLAHEHTHNLGFDHVSAKDYDSVPYKVGDIVEELGEKHFKAAMELKGKIETYILPGA